jgi:acyl carrier protein
MPGPQRLDPASLELRLGAVIRDRLGKTVTDSTSLTSLGVDSLALMELVSVLEKEFGFQADQDIFDAETVADLVRYILERSG